MQEYTYPLNENLTALIEIKRIGQDAPENSDMVYVTVSICLPSKTFVNEKKYLVPDLQFNRRVNLCGEDLSEHWGNQEKDRDVRVRREHFTFPTYRQAEDAALTWAKEELRKLADALHTRKQALIEAEL